MNLFIRADGGRAVGLGHLMRCHALAQEARRRGLSVYFLSRRGDGTGLRKLAGLGETTLRLAGSEDLRADLEATLGSIRHVQGNRRLEGSVLVTDHNGLDAAWLAGAREAGPVVVSLNDLPRIRYASHIVVNGNTGADKFVYEAEPDTRLLLGPPYTFFRDEFLDGRLRRTDDPPLATRIVIALGAGDPGNVTEDALEMLSAIEDTLDVTAVVGGAYSHLDSLEEAAHRSPHKVNIEVDLTRTAPVFAAAELAICAGGTTAYEMALLGVPAIVLVLSETQKDAAQALDAAGVALCPGEPDAEKIVQAVGALLRDADRRAGMAARGPDLFDGRGRERVLDAALACHGDEAAHG